MSTLRIGIVQVDTSIGEVEHNFTVIEDNIRELCQDGLDVIVLPETWNTGFIAGPELTALADEEGVRTQELLSSLAREYATHIVGGSVAVKDSNGIYNRTYVYDRQGTLLSQYDKVHGFSPAKEDQYFRGGAGIHHFLLDGVKCSSATCYDIRFPEFIRKAVLEGAELFFLPAQWPTLRLSHWQILNQARAIENQMFLCAVNGCGRIGKHPMAGHSMVVDPWGDVLLELDDMAERAVVTIDLDTVKEIRSRMNVFRDCRPDLY